MMIIYCVISILLAWGTFYLIKRPNVTPTRASSLLSLIAIAIIFFVDRFIIFNVEELSALVFGASFVGMCSHKKVSDLEVLFGGLLFAFLFIYCTPKLTALGIGGALGFSAFLSISISRAIYWLLNFKQVRQL